jgi:uncharacterized protein YhaN
VNTPELQDDTRYMLGVISGKIDLVLVQQANDRAVNDARFAKVEERLDATDADVSELKRDRARVLGGAAALSAFGASIAAYFGLKL